ncbi:DeoR family transcriptional regulator [Actinomadura sp. NBRC 104412]|uniref:dienelactone hydrolase family protein n=1 Tax=unclassified Actinomadura TaxID=2626254 RepID=UPI0024A3D5D4|nr:dienelactone hydrolase family protein [Actinomadura sp. NBRC 104412]GLZ08276.1 DeoR family transcriptional regulator [Actinomadura sp. NBRC 104412]
MNIADVTIDLEDAALPGDLALPDQPLGVVLFAHGSGSSRHSPRNRAVAEGLNQARIGTLLIDLLTAEEEEIDRGTGELRFDIGLLTRRLVGAIDWLVDAPPTAGFPIGLFGASTGAAGALAAAAERAEHVAAVVSRGGRPDLAGPALERVSAPVLLIVGARDPQVLRLNDDAAGRMHNAMHRLEVVPGASHLFEEPGTLDVVTGLAVRWFERYLTQRVPVA